MSSSYIVSEVWKVDRVGICCTLESILHDNKS